MMETSFKQLALQYEETAKTIHRRITQLKEARTQKPFDNTHRVEERIAILEAEYGHLLKTAAHIRENYAKPKTLTAAYTA